MDALWVDTLLVRVPQRNRTNRMCVYLHIYYTYYNELYYKELAHMVLEAGESKICGVVQWAGDPGRADATVPVGRLSATQSCLAQGNVHPFLTFRTSTCWRRSTHTMEDVCFTQFPLT